MLVDQNSATINIHLSNFNEVISITCKVGGEKRGLPPGLEVPRGDVTRRREDEGSSASDWTGDVTSEVWRACPREVAGEGVWLP